MIKEDGPVTVTAGIEGPKMPIKIQSVSKSVFRRAAALKRKREIQETLNINTDILLCAETNESLFLEE